MYVYGKNVAKDIKTKIEKAYVVKNFKDKDILSKINAPIVYVDKQKLDSMVDGLHQGIVLKIKDYDFYDIQDLTDDVIVILDHLEDPHNLGAIIRTCEAAGIKDIVIPKDRSVSINSTVMKTSAGCLDRVKIASVTNLVNTINYLKEKIVSEEACITRNLDREKINKFISSLPFALTLDQQIAVNDILKDLESEKRMNRLLEGDVGSGKTIVAFISIYANYLSKHQSALMAPTEILATQHYEEALKIFSKCKMNIALLTSSTSAKDKKEIYENLSNGKIDLIIGTQSLIQEKINYKKLGLVITDEQHRFGVNQRNIFKSKGISPDVLSMSATPIPRTYALTIYGDTDLSIIKSKPANRKPVITIFKKDKEITDVLNMMKEELDKNHQIYVVAPMIDEEEDKESESVKELEEKMTKLVDTTKETFKAEMFERSSIGTISEIYDSTEPYEERGAFAQAWSVAEIFRIVLNKR